MLRSLSHFSVLKLSTPWLNTWDLFTPLRHVLVDPITSGQHLIQVWIGCKTFSACLVTTTSRGSRKRIRWDCSHNVDTHVVKYIRTATKDISSLPTDVILQHRRMCCWSMLARQDLNFTAWNHKFSIKAKKCQCCLTNRDFKAAALRIVFRSYVNCASLFHNIRSKDQKRPIHTLAHRHSPQNQDRNGQKWRKWMD